MAHHLATGTDEMTQAIVNSLVEAGYPFDPYSTSLNEYLAQVVSELYSPTSVSEKSMLELLALLSTALSNSTISHLTVPAVEILSTSYVQVIDGISDPGAPPPPVLDLLSSHDTGDDSDNITTSTSPHFKVTSPIGFLSGDILRIYNTGALVKTVTLSSGADIPMNLSPMSLGVHDLSVTHERGGLVSRKSDNLRVTVI